MKGDLGERTKRLAIEVIRLLDSLPRDRTTDILARQMIRAASAVGANYRSACRARSRADFISRITIVEEEADEVMYWAELLFDLRVISEAQYSPIAREANELTAIFVSSAKTARRNAKPIS